MSGVHKPATAVCKLCTIHLVADVFNQSLNKYPVILLFVLYLFVNHWFSSATSPCLLSQTHRSSSAGGLKHMLKCFAELGPQ